MAAESAPTQAEIRAKGQRLLELGKAACTIVEGDEGVMSSEPKAIGEHSPGMLTYARLLRDTVDSGLMVALSVGIDEEFVSDEEEVLWVSPEGEPALSIDGEPEDKPDYASVEENLHHPIVVVGFLELADKLETAYGQPATS